jgi:hypothetical protein
MEPWHLADVSDVKKYTYPVAQITSMVAALRLAEIKATVIAVKRVALKRSKQGLISTNQANGRCRYCDLILHRRVLLQVLAAVRYGVVVMLVSRISRATASRTTGD